MHPTIRMYNFPGCPFSERIEILMALKGASKALTSVDIDLSVPRPAWLLKKTGGSTALPAIDVQGGTLKESMAILRYLDAVVPGPTIAHADPFCHAIESMLAALDSGLSAAGYRMIQNRVRTEHAALCDAVDAQFGAIDMFLRRHSPHDDFLFSQFGWAEAILTPVFKRLWFLEYYEDYTIPPRFDRLLRWRAACLAHPAAQGRKYEELIKLYYDYAQGAAGGRLLPGRTMSSFAPLPHWSTRPMPPRDKWAAPETDVSLGLVQTITWLA